MLHYMLCCISLKYFVLSHIFLDIIEPWILKLKSMSVIVSLVKTGVITVPVIKTIERTFHLAMLFLQKCAAILRCTVNCGETGQAAAWPSPAAALWPSPGRCFMARPLLVCSNCCAPLRCITPLSFPVHFRSCVIRCMHTATGNEDEDGK